MKKCRFCGSWKKKTWCCRARYVEEKINKPKQKNHSK